MKKYSDVKINEELFGKEKQEVIDALESLFYSIGIDNFLSWAEDAIPEGRNIKVYPLKRDYTIYRSSADMSYSIGFDIYDSGKSHVTPGGTLMNSSKTNGKFVIATSIDFEPDAIGVWEQKRPLQIRAVTYHAGMSVYDGKNVYEDTDAINYMNGIFRHLAPNKIKDMVY